MRLLSVCLVVLGLVGCGSNGGGDGDGSGGSSGFLGDSGYGGMSGASGAAGSSGGGRVSTGLPGNKLLGSVTMADAQTLCTSLASSSRNAIDRQDLARLPCTIAAFSSPDVVKPDGMGGATIDRAACQASVNACLQNPTEPTETEQCDATALMMRLAECDATASELETCLNATLPLISELLDQVSCDIDVNAGPPGVFEEPQACKMLDTKCPGVLDAIGGVGLPELDLQNDDESPSFDAGMP